MSSVKKEEIFIFKLTDVWSYVKKTSNSYVEDLRQR